jgi:hypothetical protein
MHPRMEMTGYFVYLHFISRSYQQLRMYSVEWQEDY